ncbi:unnamed protein product [Ectocarpus sp. 12 AP-2014]
MDTGRVATSRKNAKTRTNETSPAEHVVTVGETKIIEQLGGEDQATEGLGPAFVHDAHTSRRTSSMPARRTAARADYEGTQHVCLHKMMGSNDDAREEERGTPTPSELLTSHGP